VDLVVGVFFFALIFVPVALVIWGCVRAYRGRSTWMEGSAQLPGSPEESKDQVVALVEPRLRAGGYRRTDQTTGSVIFSRTYRPVWLAIPCILFFPIGLLSLIYSRTINLAFSLQPEAAGTKVTYSGHGPPRLRAELQSALAEIPGPHPVETA
jgi:heme/copper-type cytochrome/quinol oxidase subunit 2